MDKLLKDYQKYLDSQRLSKFTIKNYISDVRQFLIWIVDNYPVPKAIPPSITTELLKKYRLSLIKRKIPGRTINRHLSSLRSFGDYLQKEKLLLQIIF